MARRNPTQRPAPEYSGPRLAYGDVRPLDRLVFESCRPNPNHGRIVRANSPIRLRRRIDVNIEDLFSHVLCQEATNAMDGGVGRVDQGRVVKNDPRLLQLTIRIPTQYDGG